MAQIVPSLTSLPVDSTAAPSAEDIQNRLPSICVDYLSHDWQEEDVWASWRSMTRHKNEIANGVRLENASWRTWWKQRNKLRTISPETLNWLKDSDVTWLYGPLHTAVEPVPPPKVSTTDDRLGIVRHDGNVSGKQKPILKHRTLSEMLTIPMPSSPILESSGGGNDDIDELLGYVANRPVLLHTKSDTNIVRQRRVSPPRGGMGGSGSRTPTSGESSTDDMTAVGVQASAALTPSARSPEAAEAGGVASTKRHISFNTFVEQCIAVDDPEDARGASSDEDDEDDDSSSDGVLEIKSASSISSRSSRSSRPSLSRHSSASSDHVTIAKIAPTMLKTSDFPSPSPAIVYAPPEEYADLHRRRSSSSSSSGGGGGGGNEADATYDFPSPAGNNTTSQWEEDDEYSVGFDYFSGPDLGVGDEYNTPRSQAHGARAVQSHVGSGPHYGGNNQPNGRGGQQQQQQPGGAGSAPTVGQPPQQAKWRAAAAAGSPSNASTSSSPSSTAKPSPTQSPGLDTTALPNASPQGPGRSILKIRPPGSAPSGPPESTSPTSTYFNFNPSVATGFGGMGHRGQTRDQTSSSLPLYDAVQSSAAWQSSSVPPAGTVTPPGGANHGTPASPPGDVSERGRSAVRTSSLNERSASRTSTNPSSSVSPNSARLPVQIPSAAPAGAVGSNNGSSRSGARPAQIDTSIEQRVTSPPATEPAGSSPGAPSPAASPGAAKVQSPQSAASLQEHQQTASPAPADDGTPTPHSSPLITMGRMADTTPASLPHTQTTDAAPPTLSKGPESASSAAANAMAAAAAAGGSSSSGGYAKRHQRSGSLPTGGVKEPSSLRRSSGPGSNHGDVSEDEDGGTMYGRAVNIANTAKDLFGALWGYGAQPPPSATNASERSKDKEPTDGGPAF